jgi:hypothetical protein
MSNVINGAVATHHRPFGELPFHIRVLLAKPLTRHLGQDNPGAMAFTVMPKGPSSIADRLVSMMTSAFVIA